MKAFALALAVIAASATAKADGFKCQAVGYDLGIQVYNHTSPELGTRTPAVVVLSDLSVQEGRRTIAVLRSEDGLVASAHGSTYAKVDLRFKESRRKGENIGGTKLGQLKGLVIDLDFSYAAPLADGAKLDGLVTFVKRNGQKWSRELTCTRYLKN